MTTHKTIDGLAVYDYPDNGEPLVFIHAFPLNSRMWDNQVKNFIDSYHIITYDVRGAGNSTPNDHYFFTMESFSDDLFKVLDGLKIDKAHVCGLSMGGYITLRSYARQPGRFSSMILADTRAEGDDNDGLINRSNLIKNILHNGTEYFAKDFPKKLLSETSYSNKDIRSFIEDLIKHQSPENICASALAIATRVDSSEMLKDISIPVMIVVGEEDKLTPVEMSKKLHREINDSKLVVISEAGHLTAIENPAIFNDELERFLSDL